MTEDRSGADWEVARLRAKAGEQELEIARLRDEAAEVSGELAQLGTEAQELHRREHDLSAAEVQAYAATGSADDLCVVAARIGED